MRNTAPTALLAAIGLMSASALAYEILLTRIFAIVHWHHLVAIAISLALLGYGASGSFLVLMAARLKRHYAAAFIGNALLFAVSSLACVMVAQRLPFDPQALAWDGRQVLYLAATFLILAIPFFAAANCIGLTLWRFKRDIPRLYGVDLMGAGTGGFVLVAGLALLRPASALFAIFLGGVAVAVLAAFTLRRHRLATSLLALLLCVGAGLWGRPGVEPAVYKDLARSLSVHGASVDNELSGVAGVVTVVRNDRVPLRSAPGLSLQATIMPPPQRAVFLDGDAVGAIGVHRDPAQAAEYFGQLVSALPFVLRQPRRVAVLHAAVGQGVPQAISLGATQITAIEPTPQLYALVCGTYPDLTGRACDTSLVDWRLQAPRTFLAGNSGHFDLITLSAEEDAAGVDALKISFDLTIEAFGSYLQHLNERGLVAVEGGTRVPPRLALRLLQTARDALLRSGVEHPERHIAMIRGWQRFVLLVSKAPLTDADESAIRRFSTSLGFDLVWLPHIQAADANRFQVLHEPYFYRAAAALFDTSPEPAPAHYRLQAVDDDRPFPLLFTRWSAWWAAIVSGDKDAVSRLDAGLLIGTLTLALVAIASLVLILLPLWLMRQALPVSASPGPRFQTLLYFGLLGIAFLFLEIGWIQRLQLFLGHPVYATTAVLCAFLIFAGLGSLWSQHLAERRVAATLRLAVATIAVFSLAYLLFLPDWLQHLAGLPILGRIMVVFLLLAPLAFAMGIPFSTGLRRLGNSASQLVPWAWGINGCASVISAASAPLLAVETGFSGLMMAAAAAYLLLPFIRLEAGKKSE